MQAAVDDLGRVVPPLLILVGLVGIVVPVLPGLLLVPLAPHDFAVPLLIASGVIVGFAIVLYNVTAISLMSSAVTGGRAAPTTV